MARQASMGYCHKAQINKGMKSTSIRSKLQGHVPVEHSEQVQAILLPPWIPEVVMRPLFIETTFVKQSKQ